MDIVLFFAFLPLHKKTRDLRGFLLGYDFLKLKSRKSFIRKMMRNKPYSEWISPSSLRTREVKMGVQAEPDSPRSYYWWGA